MGIDTAIQLLRHRRTKIVATLGPASRSPEAVARLVEAGVNVFRLNMSHGDHDGHRENFERVHAAARAAGRPVAVLADLCGPKIRVGRFRGGAISLEAGAAVTVTVRDVEGEPGLIPSRYEALAGDVQPGSRVLLADGLLELRVEAVDGTEIRCRVVQGGELADRKGINLPDVAVSAPSLTDKDRADARFALDLGVDLLALSFVRRAADLEALRALTAGHENRVWLVAKIERPEALTHSEEVIEAADAIMVARGDLGVELPPEQVPVAQRLLIDQARERNRPVIVATQMLESMIEHARPTRAEVSDVSLAVSSGTDAVMLSGETASGRHPLAAVQTMDRIARQTEGYLWHNGAFASLHVPAEAARPVPFGDAVARSTAQLSRDLMVRAVFVISHSGMTAATVSSARPAAPVVALSANPATCRRMALLWGVIPLCVSRGDLAEPAALARRLARELRLAKPGDDILLVQGFHSDPVQNTPSITLLRVEGTPTRPLRRRARSGRPQ